MAIDSDHQPAGGDAERGARHAPCLFAVRLWKEELAGSSEYRGSVREVTTGAFRAFRDWSDLVAFMVARLERDERPRAAGGGGA